MPKGHYPRKPRSEEWKQGMREFMTGKKYALGYKHDEVWKEGARNRMLGSNNPNWKGGITDYERKKYLNLQRRARKIEADGSHTQKEWELLVKSFNYRCACCKEVKQLTEDHIVPLSLGGTDYIKNIQPLCKSCNSKKRTKTIRYANTNS